MIETIDGESRTIIESKREHFIGTYEEYGYLHRVTVEVELRADAPVHPYETTDHKPIGTHYQELGITGTVTERKLNGRKWGCTSAGQCREEVLRVTDFAPGWDANKAQGLFNIWEKWHLNGLTAGCDHQTIEYETDRYGRRVPSLKETKPCPETGYRYGSAWLVKVLPNEIIEWARNLNGDAK